jgi:hypothetical protein
MKDQRVKADKKLPGPGVKFKGNKEEFIERSNIFNSFKGKKIFSQKPGEFWDFSGVVLLFGSLKPATMARFLVVVIRIGMVYFIPAAINEIVESSTDKITSKLYSRTGKSTDSYGF